MFQRARHLLITIVLTLPFASPLALAQESQTGADASTIIETNIASTSMFGRAFGGGLVVVGVLLSLIAMSIMSWAILGVKWRQLKKASASNDVFFQKFWDSPSLSDLNNQIKTLDDCPAKEVFRSGYDELVRSNSIAASSAEQSSFVKAAMTNLNRSLQKTRREQKHKMERYLPVLAICASAAPFIGLFGTVWGIMTAFDGIAQSGNASLAAVAPGISEALIATAFGLGAAIPAVIGYNTFLNIVRGQMVHLESFSVEILNIVERFLVSGEESSPEIEKHQA